MSVTEAVLKAGVITEEQLAEMKRISPKISSDAIVSAPVPLEIAAELVDAALSGQLEFLRETDLEALRQYASTAVTSTLHLEQEDGVFTDVDVRYGMTAVGEILLPYRGENIKGMLTNGLTYLVYHDRRMFFSDVRELFYGEHKAFVVCVPSRLEEHGLAT